MACNSCAKAFTILRKEKGCPNCGFSYCAGCLNNKVFVPKINADAKVCAKCKKVLTSNENTGQPTVIPPDAYYKRLAATGVKPQSMDNPTDPKDSEIQERLNKLKADKAKKVSDDEIAKRLQDIKGESSTATDAEIYARLARLRGVPEIATDSKPALPEKDLRTEQEQVDDLMKQYLDQTQIDSKYKDEFDNVISTIESRVQKLKGTDAPASSKQVDAARKSSESEDEEQTVMKIVDKIKSEAVIDETDQYVVDELPFCEICNEDATRRCLGCRYLYCKQCFIEHKDDDDGCNRYVSYTAPNKSNV